MGDWSISTMRPAVPSTVDPVGVRPRAEPAGPEPFGQDVADQRGFAGARHARHDVQGAEPELDVDRLEVVLAGPPDEKPSRPGPALRNGGGHPVARQKIAGRARAPRQSGDAGRRALIEDAAAGLARARPEVDEVVGRAHHVLVVLDDEDGVAVVAELAEEVEQPRGVGRMEAGRRLVEDIEDAPQPVPRLRGQPDALDLAAGERVRGAVEAQVAEPEPFEQVRLFEEGGADGLAGGPAGRIELHAPELPGQTADGHRADVGDGPARDGHPEGFGPEAAAAAGAAGEGPGEAEDVVVPFRPEDRLHDRQDPFVIALLAGLGDDALPAEPRFEGVLAVTDEDAIAPVEDDVALGIGQVAPGDVDREAVGPADLVEDLHGHLGVDDVAVRRRQGQGALAQGPGRVGDEEIGIDAVLDAEAPAGRAGAFGGIEREHPPRQAQPVGRAAQPGEEEAEVVVDLGQRPDRGPGAGGRRPLADGDGRGEAADVSDLGPPELAQELAGVGGERLEVAPLRLAEDDVEDERGFARARNAGDDGHPAVRDVDVDVAEIVLRGVTDGQDVHGGLLSPRARPGQTAGRNMRQGISRGALQIGPGPGEARSEITAREGFPADVLAASRGVDEGAVPDVDPDVAELAARRRREEDEIALRQPVPGDRRSRPVLVPDGPGHGQAVQPVDREDQSAAIEARTGRRSAPRIIDADEALRRGREPLAEVRRRRSGPGDRGLRSAGPDFGIIGGADDEIFPDEPSLLQLPGLGEGGVPGGEIPETDFEDAGTGMEVEGVQARSGQGPGQGPGVVVHGERADLDGVTQAGQGRFGRSGGGRRGGPWRRCGSGAEDGTARTPVRHPAESATATARAAKAVLAREELMDPSYTDFVGCAAGRRNYRRIFRPVPLTERRTGD